MEMKFFKYKGTVFPSPSSSVEDLDFLENEFKVRDDDVFNVTYPKSGTTWMLEILSLIKTNGDPTWSKSVLNWHRIPWIESKGSAKKAQEVKDNPRFFNSHLPRHLFIKSLSDSKAKVIYTVRDPRDVIVSHFYFGKISVFFNEFESIDELIKEFLWSEELPYGSWFDHVKEWIQLVGKENFMLNSYEDMQKDLRGTVIKICKFLGKELDDTALDSVVKHSSFKTMQENNMSNFTQVPDTLMDQKRCKFIRNGICGDWKNHFTVAQAEYFDKIYNERMLGCSVKFPWEEK
ncbi:sulfotransferase 2B1-like [Anomaloglossus baeobatrachus]|uniref:sulfotransferase 2B1-like n=1 Tax=Anomaloglossus baeobatrachus TaxID=238106 RepID=UPI003F500899